MSTARYPSHTEAGAALTAVMLDIFRANGALLAAGDRLVAPLGLLGGFVDASGGGGWGPVVTSNLLIQGASPRHTIGTVNTVEFFLTLSISLTFLFNLGWQTFTVYTVGLLVGGVVAAPFGAMLARRVAPKVLMIAVGIILTLTSAFGVAKQFGVFG